MICRPFNLHSRVTAQCWNCTRSICGKTTTPFGTQDGKKRDAVGSYFLFYPSVKSAISRTLIPFVTLQSPLTSSRFIRHNMRWLKAVLE